MNKINSLTIYKGYDSDLKVDKKYKDTLPDLQNGEGIEGVKIEKVGIHNFRLPLKWKVKDSQDTLTLETSVTGTVSLQAMKKGINMSRIMRTFYEYRQEEFTLETLIDILYSYRKKLDSFDAHLLLKISYPVLISSLRSNNAGYQYYDVVFEVLLNEGGELEKIIHFDFVYSSSCPCSYELSLHALERRGRAVVPHSQRSTTRISLKYKEDIWIEDIRQLCLNALKTETQVVVLREDEQAFAELNGSNLKFVEDAIRQLYLQFSQMENITDFKIICSHLESLHSHDAIAVLVKGIKGGFSSDVTFSEWRSLVR